MGTYLLEGPQGNESNCYHLGDRMNERFNQLLKQVEEETNAEYQDESRRKRRLYNEILLPKFAELIIQECFQACMNEGASYEEKAAGAYQSNLYVTAIKRHFGVEE